MMKRIKLVLSAALFLGIGALQAQERLVISQELVLQKISENNLQGKISEQSFAASRADYRQSNALFLPSISASHTAMTTTNPLMAFGSKLNQERLTASDFNPSLLNDPTRINNYATKLSIQQPIINLDGWLERKAAKATMEAFSLEAARNKEYLQLEGAKAYMQLQLAYKAVAVLAKAKETAETQQKIVEEYYKQGLIQKPDLLAITLRVNEVGNQLQYANSNIQNASDYVAFLMHEKQDGILYQPASDLDDEAPVVVGPENTISDRRKDLLAMEQSTKAYQLQFQATKMKLLPRLNAFGSYELFDTQLFHMGAVGYTLGAQLSWDLFDGYRSIAKVEKAKINYQKANMEKEQYHDQSKLEWHKAQRQLRDAANKVALATLAVTQAEEAYRIRQNRFAQGLEKANELLAAETQMLEKQMDHLQALFEYKFTQKYLQFLTR